MQKQDLRIVKTLRQIDQALLENLKEYSIQKITVDMLCQSALINRSTFYKYYKDKYDLLDQYLDRILNDFRNAFESTDFILATPDTIQNQEYTDNFYKSIQFIYARRNTYMILWDARISRSIFHEMVAIIHQNIMNKIRERGKHYTQQQEQYQNLYSELFASNLMTMIYWWFQNESTICADDIRELMKSNMKKGLFSTFKDYM